MSEPAPGLPFWRLVVFSACAMPIYAVQVPLSVYLPAIFAQSYGLSLSLLGTIFLIEKLWGTLADPIIGVFSDRTRSRFGRRRSWILAGGVVFGSSGIFLFFPPAAMSALYLGITLFVFYLGWSMIQIPFFAWSGELSGGYHERTRVATYQTVTGSIALLLLLVVPTVIDRYRPSDGVLKLNAMGALILATLVVGIPLTLGAFSETTAPVGLRDRLPFVSGVRLALGNKLLMRVIGSDFAVSLGQNIRAVLFVFFVSSFMLAPQWASGLFLIQFLFGIAAGPIWMLIGYRLGKHHAAICGELIQVGINLGLLFLIPGRLPLLFALTIAQGLAQGSGNLMLRSMVADVSDQHRLQTGIDRTGLFFSVFSVSVKAATAVAVGVALPLVARLGFDPKSLRNTPGALHGLLLVFALGPAISHLISAALITGFPLDAVRHAEIRRGLELRDSETAARTIR
jgi:glycoside/pentoside/hexuronide:cation symporter, GPH family